MKSAQFDHVAFEVKDVKVSVAWYLENYEDSCVIYSDDTWGMVAIDGVKIALVLEGTHPSHVAIRQTCPVPPEAKRHRDLTYYVYDKDPDGNTIERIWYPHSDD